MDDASETRSRSGWRWISFQCDIFASKWNPSTTQSKRWEVKAENAVRFLWSARHWHTGLGAQACARRGSESRINQNSIVSKIKLAFRPDGPPLPPPPPPRPPGRHTNDNVRCNHGQMHWLLHYEIGLGRGTGLAERRTHGIDDQLNDSVPLCPRGLESPANASFYYLLFVRRIWSLSSCVSKPDFSASGARGAQGMSELTRMLKNQRNSTTHNIITLPHAHLHVMIPSRTLP